MRLVSWNVAGRLARQPEQAAAVLAMAPDVVALQEVTVNSLPLWREALAAAGLEHTLSPLDDGPLPKPRRLAVLTASRTPLRRLPLGGLPWPERALSVEVGGIELLNVHSPISPSPGLAKVLTHEVLFAYARERDGIVLAGDLNTPRRTHDDGTVLTFAHDTKGRLRPERGERWAAAERALVYTLRAEHGWRDAFLDAPERTWTFANDRGGWRLDHLLVKGVEVTARAYAHGWRRSGLSDHSAIVAELRG
ncbi:MAG TPA: endonuclease/exonuclease/phosphatase family protein [Solirubrobacteraceae bacterium]|jgi:exonuclease III|nr:endonuclease/exonuclease/phosphatase family protein [Solirubrobacteraceae bacterium]